MNRLVPLAVLLVVAAGCCRTVSVVGGDPEATYTIVAGDLRPRDRIRITQHASGTVTYTGISRRVEKHGWKYECIEEILQRPPGEHVTRARRVYTTAERIEAGIVISEVYRNSTVLIEKKAGCYVFRIEGGQVITGPGLKHLEETYRNRPRPHRKKLLPSGAVKLNETWTIPKDVAARAVDDPQGMKIDAAKITATGKLVRVYRRNGKQFGELRFHLEIPLAGTTGPFLPGATLEPGGRFVVDSTLRTAIDGSVSDEELEARTTVEMTVISFGIGGRIKTRVRVEQNVSQSEKLVE